MPAYSVSADARARLLRAQRAESEALSAATKALGRMAAAQARLATAERAFADTVSALIAVSGAERTARLLELSAPEMRALRAKATHDPRPSEPEQAAVPDDAPEPARAPAAVVDEPPVDE